jgi:glycosyltransferase involved in cell wall biosynthesis
MEKRAAIIGSASLEFNGGAERNVLQIAKVLTSIGYEVTVFTPRPVNIKNAFIDTSYFNYVTTAFNMDLFGSKTMLRITHGTSIGFIGMFSFNNIYKYIKGFDLYYFVNPNFLFARAVKYFYLQNKHPEIILGNHGTYFEILNRKFIEKPIISILNNMIFPYATRNTIKVQVQNNFQHNFYRRLGIPEGGIIDIPEGGIIDIPQCDVSFDKYGITPHESFNVVYLNKLSKNKGYSILKKLLKKSGNFNINVIGYHENMDKIRKKYASYNNVKFWGFLSEDEKIKVLSESDVIVNLSKYESLSVSSTEGLAAGLCLLGPDISGLNLIKKLVPEGTSILDKRKPEDYMELIKNYQNMKMSNPDKFNTLRNNIKSSAKMYFDKPVIENSLKNMFVNPPHSDQKISIVTASLNERDNIKKWLDQILTLIELKNITNIDEIVIVDDGSTDGTVEIIESYQRVNYKIKINLIKRDKKMGTVNAQITGAKHAKNEYILVLDCDLQHPTEYIPNFVDAFNYGYDIVIGSRYIIGSKNNWEPEREVISRVATIVAHIFFPFTHRIKDPLSGYFLCKRHMLSDLYPYKFMYKPLLYLLIFNSKDRNYREIPIEMQGRKTGTSKIVNSYSKTVFMYFREILIYYREGNKLRWKIK